MKTTELPQQVYEFLAWLSHRDFIILDRELPPEYEAPLAVARAANPPLVHTFDTGIADEALVVKGDTIPMPPHLGVRLTREGSAVLALHDMQRRTGESSTTTTQVDDGNWLTQTKVREGLGYNKNQRMRIHRLCEKGELRTNGKDGRDCRIDPASVLEYCKREGIAWNDT